MEQIIKEFWTWLKANDIPNWIAIVLWPLAIFLWDRRTVSTIPNLEVSLFKGKTKIGENDESDALYLKFLNNTSSIIYLTNICILNCSKKFHVDPAAARDIAKSSYELKFPNGKDGYLTERQIILHTNAETSTSLSVKNSITDDMLSYKPNILRQVFRRPKYFCLQYIALVGNKRYRVSTTY